MSDPLIQSGRDFVVGPIEAARIYWPSVVRLTVERVRWNDDYRYRVCVTFDDDTWADLSAPGELEEARRIAHRLSAVHDRPVSDPWRTAS